MRYDLKMAQKKQTRKTPVSRSAPDAGLSRGNGKKRKRKPSSSRWLERQAKDIYVHAAQREGYRSRAAYKLIELDDKFHILKAGQRVIDLGAAPGGWTQVAVSRVHAGTTRGGRVLAVDLKPLDPIRGAHILTQNVLEEKAVDQINAILEGQADVVLSDMAAPSTGHRKTDALRVMTLCEVALDFSTSVLNPGGSFVVKVLKVGAEIDLVNRLKRDFHCVRYAKPPSSRSDSSESYIVANGFRG